MNNNNNIALCISGTKLRQAGFAPLVSIGFINEEEEKQLDRTTLIVGKPVYVLKHKPDCIIYEAIDRKVKPFDRDTPGVLSIGLAIPARCQLAGGKSPYTLLKEIYDTFVSEYMAPVNDGRHSYLDKYADDTIFRKILDNYPLESRETQYVTMDQNPTGLTATLCLPESKIEEFFRDSQYNEFSRYKDIEIGFDCPTTTGLENLEIPRPKRYEVFVNGRPTNKFMTNPDDFYTTGETNTDAHTYNNISFCLKYLLESPDNRYQEGSSYAVLDKLKNQINCEVSHEERKYVCNIKVSGVPKNIEEQVLSYVKSGQIAITIGDRKFSSFREPDDKFRLPYSYLNKSASVMQLNIDGYNIGGAARLEWDPRRQEACIDIRPIQAFATQPTRDRGYTNYQQTNRSQRPNADYYNQTDRKPSYQDPSDVVNSKSDKSNPRKPWVAIIALVAAFLLGGIVGRVAFPVKNIEEYDQRIANLKDSCDMFEQKYSELKESVDKAEAAKKEAEAAKAEKAEKEAEAAKKEAEAAKAKAKAEAEANAKKEKVRQQILDLVNSDQESSTKLTACRALWDIQENKKFLTQNEKNAIEVVLAYKVPDGKKFKNKKLLEKAVKDYLKTVGPFKDYKSLIATQNKIVEIENEHLVDK